MTRLQALEALLEKVEAGDVAWSDIKCAFEQPPNLEAAIRFKEAFSQNSLDAAKALHEAVLDGWHFDIDSGSGVCVYKDNLSEVETGHADNPSPAWLIAILKALITKEKAS
jgi:hypothetical protein